MPISIEPVPSGAKGSFTLLVTPDHLANRFKDAMLPPVLATPVTIMIMENAALNAVGRLLLGEDLIGVALPVARVAGIALIGLGVACWPGPARIGMLIYGAAVTVFLAYVGLTGGGGVLLWPAVVLHAILTALLTRAAPSDKAVKS